jgi:hypothetical protein
MEKLPEEITEATRAFAENERRSVAEEHPPAEDLVAYHEGKLAEAADDELRRHLVSCSECTHLLLDLQSFADLEPPEETQRLSDDDIAAQKEDLKLRIAADGIGVDDPEPQTTVLPFERPKTSIPPAYWAALAALVLVTLGMGLRNSVRLETGGTPEVFELFADETFRSPDANTLRVPAWADSYVLTFTTLPSRRYTTFRIEIRDASGELVLADEPLHASYDGTVKRVLARDRLSEGAYEVLLLGLSEGPPEPRGEYSFQLVFETQ